MRSKQSQRPIRYLQLSTESFSAFKFLAPLSQYLDQTGRYEGNLACNTDGFADARSYAQELRDCGFVIDHLPIPRGIDPASDVRACVKITRYLRSKRIDILHTHNSKAGILGRIAGRLAGVPVIVHSAYDYGPLMDSWGTPTGTVLAFAERLAGRCSDRILFISEDGVKNCRDWNLAPAEKLVNVGVGISFDEFDSRKVSESEKERLRNELRIPSSQRIVGTLARLTPHKGVDTLVQAAALVNREEPDVHFLVAGGGPEEAGLRRMADELGLNGNISFTGFIKDQSKVPTLFSLMDVFWLATRREGFGLVYTEANAMGVPVIGSNIPPVDFVIGENIGGLLADPESPNDFSRCCINLLRDSDLRSKLGQNGFSRAKRLFDERLTYEKIVAVYDELLESKEII
ncbi:MAG: glycosyltransferase [Verrucomicrobia bacterium]|nr:glycosyltransferase [Verrucomicrobiota bacterium]